jgi:L-threonylcarbamoyladenylate synthase
MAAHVLEMLGDKIDIILDGGPTQVGLESTVLDLCHGQPRILRPGGVSRESIEALIGEVACGSPAGDGVEHGSGMASPGMLESHYAPRVPLTIFNPETPYPALKKNTMLFFDGASRDAWLAAQPPESRAAETAVLSVTGNMVEAAAKLFETLHNLDRTGIERIHAQLVPESGLGAAINDRLRRAAF